VRFRRFRPQRSRSLFSPAFPSGGAYSRSTPAALLKAGPAGIFICDECVAICDEIIAGRMPTSKPPSEQELPTERLLEQLGAIEQTVQGKGSQLQGVVELLRSREVSWAQIGAALGISRQSAWERFS
jgi:ATP-dependent Clp protease ATP-binding subunit ClpX